MKCILFILLLIYGISSSSQIPLYNHISVDLPLNSDSLLVDSVICIFLSSPYCKACVDDLGALLCNVANNTHKINVVYHATMSSSNYWLYFHTLKKSIPCLADLYFSSSVYGAQTSITQMESILFNNKTPCILYKNQNQYKSVAFDSIFGGDKIRPEFEKYLLRMVK